MTTTATEGSKMSDELDDSEMLALALAQAATRERMSWHTVPTADRPRPTLLVALALRAARVLAQSSEGSLSLVQKDVVAGRVGVIASAYMATLSEPVRALLGQCESEIERLFLAAFLAPTPGLELTTPDDLVATCGPAVEIPPSATRLWCHMVGGAPLPAPAFPVRGKRHAYSARPVPLWLVPQYEIALPDRNVRVDFAAIPAAGSGCPSYAVELDGHDFHERTREQATNDKSRDRALLAAGWHTLRFTGSEIFKDPSACVDQVRFTAFWESLRRDPTALEKVQRGAA